MKSYPDPRSKIQLRRYVLESFHDECGPKFRQFQTSSCVVKKRGASLVPVVSNRDGSCQKAGGSEGKKKKITNDLF